MSSFNAEHSSSAIRRHEGQPDTVVRVRRRRDLLAAAGLALVAAGTGAVAMEARAGGGSAHVAARVTPAHKPVLAASSVGVRPGQSGAAHAAAAVSQARAARVARVALARNAIAMQSVGGAGRTAGLLKALPPVHVPVTQAAVPSTSTPAPTPTAPASTYTTPAAPAPTYTAPTYTAPAAPAPTYTAPAAPTPTPTPTPSSGGGSAGGGSSSSGSGGSGSVSGGG